jgi:hypothetical protein
MLAIEVIDQPLEDLALDRRGDRPVLSEGLADEREVGAGEFIGHK